MILVDTSVWVDHLRRTDPALVPVLERGEALAHPFVIGEIALGDLKQPGLVIGLLQSLPAAPVAEDREVLAFIAANGLGGSGLGYVDAHLLASVRLRPGSSLWTRDKRLRAVALRLGLGPPASVAV